MVVLSYLYVTYGNLPQVNDVLYILKPAVLGIIAAGIIKLGRAAIKNTALAVILVVAILAMYFFKVDFLIVLLIAGLAYLLFAEGLPRFKRTSNVLPALIVTSTVSLVIVENRWLQMAWLFLKTGLFSFGGAYASLVFLQRGAVDQFHWLSAPQLLDGVALSVATPGPFMLFTTFVGYLAGGLKGAAIATFFVFLPSFVLVLIGAKYIEQVQNNHSVQAFLAGVSAAVVGVILVVSLELIPGALVDLLSVIIMALVFSIITFLKVDVARVAIGTMVAGIGYAVWHTLQ
jgi:chromate transporter